MSRLLLTFILANALISVGCGHSYLLVTFQVEDAETSNPIGNAHIKSLPMGHVLDLQSKPELIDSHTDSDGRLRAMVPFDQSAVAVNARGYDRVIVQDYLNATFVRVSMKKLSSAGPD